MKLELKNIDKSFGEKKVLERVSFTAEGGRAFGLLGRNGAGKTTTIPYLWTFSRQTVAKYSWTDARSITRGSASAICPRKGDSTPKEDIRSAGLFRRA